MDIVLQSWGQFNKAFTNFIYKCSFCFTVQNNSYKWKLHLQEYYWIDPRWINEVIPVHCIVSAMLENEEKLMLFVQQYRVWQ